MFATHPKVATAERLCSSCGSPLVGTRCPECSPIEPARAYHERVTQPVGAGSVDGRRANGEWMTAPDERDPQTRRAHPTLVRAALDEAEERARDRLARVALVTPSEAARPRVSSTAPRLRPVTPLPPEPLPDPDAPPTVIVVKSVMAEAPVEVVPPPAPCPAIVEPPPPAPVTMSRALPEAGLEASPELADPSHRRAAFFWLGLAAVTAVVLVIAAI